MTPEEANKIIAEYMGKVIYPKETEFMPQDMDHIRIDFLNYDKSLDALVPVWEKLNIVMKLDAKHGKAKVQMENHLGVENTIQEAACVATAKAIKELKDEL